MFAGSGWKPITDEQKDGTELLLWPSYDGRVFHGFYIDGFWFQVSDTALIQHDPIYWQGLPEPPVTMSHLQLVPQKLR